MRDAGGSSREGAITFYATSPHGYTFQRFLDRWAPELASRVRIVGYSTIDLAAPPEPGLHVLTDFERLLRPERAFVSRLYHRLRNRLGVHVIGDPGPWLNRRQLLTRLADDGINDFRAYTVDQCGPHVRFPVFLRWANEHTGSLGGPIGDQAELDERLADLAHRHHRRWRWIRDQLLVVEELDARSADGHFRKYSILRIGSEFVPAHMITTDDWVSKYATTSTTADLVREETAFLDDPADLDLIKHAFDISGIEFGRIDWGYVNGRPQIWEINTNPMLAPGVSVDERRLPAQIRQSKRTIKAIESLVPAPQNLDARALVGAPERWLWNALKSASRRLDPKRA